MKPLLAPGSRLVVATHNKGKVPELAALLEGRFDLVSAGELGLPEPEETEHTFEGNALLKARHAAKLANLPALADDSGLSVAALDGKPGIYSARWAGVNPDGSKDFGHAMDRVQWELADAADRSAWFTCALAVVWPDGTEIVEEGRVDGTLTFPGRGTNGHGYDPIFMPEESDRTFAEMTEKEKEAVSHRARAFAKLRARLF